MKSILSLRGMLFFALGLIGFGFPSQSNAHFLFIRVGEHAEAGKAAEVFFSERAAAGDPRFIGKVAGTRLWMQQESGTFVPLKPQLGTDRLRAYLPSEGAVSVTGVCEYGVLEREVPFLLRYYPKAISGTTEEIHAFKPHEQMSLEIMTTIVGDAISLTLLDHGKPVPNAVFTTVDDDLKNEELKADGEGKAMWKPANPGHYSIYSKVVRKEAGELNGKKYSEIREFPTIAFQWPLGRTDGDQEAVAMFQKAMSTRASWRDFPGFASKIAGEYEGRPFSGEIQIDRSGEIVSKIDQEVATPWVEEQLKSLVMHRMESSQRPTPVLRFADRDLENPLGRLLTYVGGHFAASYRVKDDQLKTVNRHLGKENMTITVLENEKNRDGKYLPRFYTVQYWNAADGQFLRTETIENRWVRLGQFDLPSLNSVTTASSSGLVVRNFRLTDHVLKGN